MDDRPFSDPSLVDIEVPEALVGEPPADLALEGEVLAWGPFMVELPQAWSRPELGSRLRVVWVREAAEFLVVFFPWYLGSDRVISMDEVPRPEGDTLVFQSKYHGPGRIRPVTREDILNSPPDWLRVARQACDLEPAGG